MTAQIPYLAVAIVTGRYAMRRLGRKNLLKLNLPVGKPFFFEIRQNGSPPATAAIIIGSVRLHIYKIFFPYDWFDNESQIFGNGIPITFSDNLTGILYSEFDFKIFIPIGVDL